MELLENTKLLENGETFCDILQLRKSGTESVDVAVDAAEGTPKEEYDMLTTLEPGYDSGEVYSIDFSSTGQRWDITVLDAPWKEGDFWLSPIRVEDVEDSLPAEGE